MIIVAASEREGYVSLLGFVPSQSIEMLLLRITHSLATMRCSSDISVFIRTRVLGYILE
jgi:hypothetical protein